MSQDGGKQATAYFWGILTMMGAPFLLLSVIGGLVYLSVRRHRKLATA